MKNFRIFFLIGLLAASPASGASKNKTPPINQTPVITSVTANSVSITEGKITRTLAITQFTEITVNGVKATAAELKPGMNVNVTLGIDSAKASRINASGK
jgi:hypothetical protein